MPATSIKYGDISIAWQRFGHGPVPVFCFHGYGESAARFAFLASELGASFSFYAIDLPDHGHTIWKESAPPAAADILTWLQEIHAVDPSHPAGLLGFSLGGRVALSLYEQAPDHFDRLVLLAPDGLKVNRWYWFATQTSIGNRLFAFTMKRPGWFFRVLKTANGLGLVNTSIFKFVNHYIGDAQARQLLYRRWTSLRKIKPNLPRIRASIRRYHTPVRLIYGQHDRIILSSVGERFCKGLQADAELTVISSGHQVLHEKHIAVIARALQH